MIIGHQKIISNLERRLEKGVLSHSHLFTGPESVGKFTVAYELAGKMVGKTGIVNGELMVIFPEEISVKNKTRISDIKVEAVRGIERHLSRTTFSGGAKVVIIDQAERMTTAAQNALLKILEEPPENSFIFLVASDVSRLLPTVISRTEVKRFNVVEEAGISRLVSSSSRTDEIIFWSMGRPGLAKKNGRK